MNRLVVLMILSVFILMVSCGSGKQNENEVLVLIKTEFGDIKVKLFNETPQHKENFIKLASEGYYNDLLFHRVINNFMIQGGDPMSKDAKPGDRLGGGSPGYTIPAEFMPEKYFHKKGALAAARTGGASNPEKRSSGSQFYIVQGRIFTEGQLDTLQITMESRRKNELMQQKAELINDELQAFRTANDQQGFNMRIAELREEVDSIFNASASKIVFTEEQRKVYSTIGGYPSLDGEYTVFGEVVDGFDVLDKIAAVETGEADRPLQDIKMTVELIK
jgi:cyclophilin family peptidyl-prolyl cis-trans isomerase